MLRRLAPALLLVCLTPALGACVGFVEDEDVDGPLAEDEDVPLPVLTLVEDEPNEGVPCDSWGDSTQCVYGLGTNFCGDDSVPSEDFVFGPCIPLEEIACQPGDWEGQQYCTLRDGIPQWIEIPDPDTPLVLRFDGTPLEMIAAESTPMATFDISMREGSCITTDWPSAATPWLALDRDGNGRIDGGHELFGSGTLLDDGTRADHGFEALAQLDANGDGRIDARDPMFAELLVWRDHDADRRSLPGELEPLASAGIESLELDSRVVAESDARGNTGLLRSRFAHAGGGGELVDMFLPCR